MQTSATSSFSPETQVAASVSTALRELSIDELFAVSGGSPKGGWQQAAEGSIGGTEVSSPKGGW